MEEGDLFILREDEVTSILAGREQAVMQAVEEAYLAHANQESVLPYSSFLTFPNSDVNRIIALPAYLGHRFDTAGVKWISSFPENLDRGLNRASAVIVLNSMATGRAEALLEGAVISAQRTAASAALAARHLLASNPEITFGFIGCGLINAEVLRFLKAALPSPARIFLYDHVPERAEAFSRRCRDIFTALGVVVCDCAEGVLAEAPLVSIATTGTRPHIIQLPGSCGDQVVLHLSLRDIAPKLILEADNIVDDVDHVCRADTSVHIAEQIVGNRSFIRGTIAEILSGQARAKRRSDAVTIFSPFGLGVLDIAVAKLVRDIALEQGLGLRVRSFFASTAVGH